MAFFDAALVPMRLEGDRLVGHVARANPIWRAEGRVLAVFTPVDGYVSPGWYPSKQEHGRVVPTWNYVTVHAHGPAEFRDNVVKSNSPVGKAVHRTGSHERLLSARFDQYDAGAALPSYGHTSLPFGRSDIE